MARMLADIVGWASALILILTISRQVYKQWRTRSTAGVSSWLFIGQLAASTGFVIYSYLVENWVFVATNAFMLLTAVTGQLIYRSNRRREEREQGEKEGQQHPGAATRNTETA
jgi:MtN3 and saliva related transmembrane protein